MINAVHPRPADTDQARRAVRAVASNATDAADLIHLLDLLGLNPQQGAGTPGQKGPSPGARRAIDVVGDVPRHPTAGAAC